MNLALAIALIILAGVWASCTAREDYPASVRVGSFAIAAVLTLAAFRLGTLA